MLHDLLNSSQLGQASSEWNSWHNLGHPGFDFKDYLSRTNSDLERAMCNEHKRLNTSKRT